MKAARIIRLLAEITTAAALCSCGGGGGGGGGTTDKGWSYHPGSTDPQTQVKDMTQLLRGRTLFLQGDTSYTFHFEDSGKCTVKRTLRGSVQSGTLTYTYTPNGEKSATAEFLITYDEAWVDIDETDKLNATFTYASATQATCELRVNNTTVGEVPATFRMISDD